MRAGDLVCILDECRFPMIFEKTGVFLQVGGRSVYERYYERRSGRGVEEERRNNPDI
jgi:hypothetical protein